MAEGFTLQVQGISDALWEPIDLVIPSTRPAAKVVGRGSPCVTSRAHFVCASHRLSVESDSPTAWPWQRDPRLIPSVGVA